MSLASLVLLHAGGASGLAAIAVLCGMAVFVLVLAYLLSALQREQGGIHAQRHGSPRSPSREQRRGQS